MLPHRCILSNCAGAFELVRPLRLKDEIYLSYLPLSHAYRTHGRAVLPAQPGHRNRLCPRRRASGGRHAGGAPDDPDRGAAGAGGDPHARADPGGAGEAVPAAPVPDGAGDRPEAGGRRSG